LEEFKDFKEWRSSRRKRSQDSRAGSQEVVGRAMAKWNGLHGSWTTEYRPTDY
jgi:hypothetical protein